MKRTSFLRLIAAIVVCGLAGFIGSIFTASAIPTWYAALAKPALNPPAWLFGPVWTILYILMAIALWMVWKKTHTDVHHKRQAITLFFIQLILNAWWSVIFFGLHFPGGAFLELIALWIVIALTIIAFAKISKAAAWLLVPYIVWVSFAGYLNYSIWQLSSSSHTLAPVHTLLQTITYTCDHNRTITASYFEGSKDKQTNLEEKPHPTGSVAVSIGGTPTTTLAQTISASGIRYANADESLVFWSKGNTALVMRNNSMDLQYTNCVAKK